MCNPDTKKCQMIDKVLPNLNFLLISISRENAISWEDSNKQKDSLIEQVSQDITDLISTNKEGKIDRDSMQKASLLFGKIATSLLEISVNKDDITELSKKSISDSIEILLKEILC